MRGLLAIIIVGLALGVLATAALACNDDAYNTGQPPNAPLVQQPQQPTGSS